MTRFTTRHASSLTSFALASLLGLAACVAPQDSAPGDEPTTEPAAASEQALAIERAERVLDRGGDAAAAKAELLALQAAGNLAPRDRRQAILALSRAHEALGEDEQAVAIIEAQLAAHGDDRDFPHRVFRKRLRQLLVGEQASVSPRPDDSKGSPFALALAKYFPKQSDGTIRMRMFVVGGDHDRSDAIGTFDVKGALRAQREAECSLCDVDLDMHNWTRGSDWTLIPEAQSEFGEGLVVFYYDLEAHRIPARYASHLPMDQKALDALLEGGKSVLAAKERSGAPPVVLIAAPHASMLEDAERRLADLDHLPLEPVELDITRRLRPKEIRARMRGAWRSDARACYETLLKRAPEARGRLVLHLTVGADGSLTNQSIDPEEGLRDDAFMSCMTDATAKLRFPAAGRETKITYPVTLHP